MREAMARAEVGDDCWGDDPTVIALQDRMAELLGKEAAVFVPSGTMANQLAVGLHVRPGEAIAAHPGAHVQVHEDASAARLSGAQIMPIGTRGGYDVAALETLIHQEECGWPRVGLVWVENTIGDAAGAVWPVHDHAEAQAVSGLESIARATRAHGRALHLDGARLWNAVTASGTSLERYASLADTVSCAFSKGLGAPAGSILAGSSETIARARAHRHALGGSMRQAGILAAACSYALEHHRERLAQDHERARLLAERLAEHDGWSVQTPQTNMVIAHLHGASAPALCERFAEHGILCSPNRYDELRFVLHLGIDDEAVDAVTRAAVQILA